MGSPNSRPQTPGTESWSRTPSDFSIQLQRAENLPHRGDSSGVDFYVVFEVFTRREGCVARARSAAADRKSHTWWELISLPSSGDLASPDDLLPEYWDLETAEVRLTLCSHDAWSFSCGAASCWAGGISCSGGFVGQCSISFLELIAQPTTRLLLEDRQGNAVLSPLAPHMPYQLSIEVSSDWMPKVWPAPITVDVNTERAYPKHIFMMTRGTRGDVQPFVALARGMAEEQGWLVTICTESRWRGFVLESTRGLRQGAVRFRSSGGDTEVRMQGWAEKIVLQARSDFVQMIILAMSESAFFGSATVFIDQVKDLESSPKPVDLIVFGLTVAGVAALVGEHCHKPLAGFMLQPSCIPSADERWAAIQSIPQTGTFLDRLSEMSFTGHGTLAAFKAIAERNPMAACNLDVIRQWFDLAPSNTWAALESSEIPLVIPMHGSAFYRPPDWRPSIEFTDFIFLHARDACEHRQAEPELLRFEGCAAREEISRGDPLDAFISNARTAGAKMGLMTFSSMPVLRRQVLSCCVRMVRECSHHLRLAYVGQRQDDTVPAELAAEAEELTRQGRLIEVERADFGEVFRHMDLFVVHGGLGTTVEAIRSRKPVTVTGPLLLDQRFWGNVCHERGVGLRPMHIEDFQTHCVAFADAALDPADALRLQTNAISLGDALDGGAGDGVSANVAWFADHVASGRLRSIQQTKSNQSLASCDWLCRPLEPKCKGGIRAHEFEDDIARECLSPMPGIGVFNEMLHTFSDCEIEIADVPHELDGVAKWPPCARECCSARGVGGGEEVIQTHAQI